MSPTKPHFIPLKPDHSKITNKNLQGMDYTQISSPYMNLLTYSL